MSQVSAALKRKMPLENVVHAIHLFLKQATIQRNHGAEALGLPKLIMEKKMETTIVCWDYSGIMEKWKLLQYIGII